MTFFDKNMTFFAQNRPASGRKITPTFPGNSSKRPDNSSKTHRRPAGKPPRKKWPNRKNRLPATPSPENARLGRTRSPCTPAARWTFPQYGKLFPVFSTQWKKCFHTVENFCGGRKFRFRFFTGRVKKSGSSGPYGQLSHWPEAKFMNHRGFVAPLYHSQATDKSR